MQKANQKSTKKQSTFELNLVLSQVHIKISNQQQKQLCNELIVNLNMNARQKLKHYKKILQTNDQKLIDKKKFINSHLKSILLQQYIQGNTQAKPALLNLIKKFQIITYSDLIKVTKNIQQWQFIQIRLWSQILDLLFKIYSQKPTNQQYKQLQKVIERLIIYVIEGKQMICRNQFKTKWLTTYTETLRTANLIVRVFNNHLNQQTKSRLIDSSRKSIQKAGLLSKQVITQLFLLLIFLNPSQQKPSADNLICQIHFLHAQNIVLSKPNLREFLQLIPKLKQTQQKCQLLPLLQQSFIQHYKNLDQNLRINCFDNVINLFQVGRSIYAYLENIVKIIIQNGDPWNIQGNFVRKFFIATVVLKFLPTKQIITQWPSIIQDLIIQCGNMSVPYAAQCAKLFFQKLYQQNNNDYTEWSKYWIQTYKKKILNSNQKTSIRGVIQFINPILLRINLRPFLLKDLLHLSEQKANSSLQLGIISLIKCYKQLGQIQVDQKKQMFLQSQDKSICFSYDKIKNFLLSNDQMIALQALQLISCSLKPSQFIKPMEMNLCIQFYENSLKTSMPEYRKNYLAVTRKLFDRLRNIYDSHVVADNKGKKVVEKQYFAQFLNFLNNMVNICFKNVFPDAIFELVNPALQILQLIQTYFGNRRVEVKKGIVFQPSNILKKTSFYQHKHFQSLLSCLQSSYQSVRKLAHQLLNYFTQIDNKQILLQLWNKSVENTNKLAIRSYQYSCRILTYISQVYPHVLQVPQKYKKSQINMLHYFLTLMKQRYAIFKSQFIKQGANYYKNLIHGLLTVFSYSLDHLAELLKNKYEEFRQSTHEIRQFLNEFFIQIINILNFSVEISSSNVSTVVLDTLTQPSQTDKKLKVDCRGHFLTQNKNQKNTNIGSFLQSTALISSMQDDQQGIQNTLVVSFYLLTRQAGLVFQSLGGLLTNQHFSEYIPSENLINLINTYFYALINLKHMGSVDRISKGLGKMSKVIFEHQSKQLSQLPEILTNKLLNHLKQGNFTNILRRSAGVPYAFSCLLKSQSLKRFKSVQKSITSLLEMSKQNKQIPIELRIHSLNILKKLFQDSDLKNDLDPYVSDAFISSIKGFTSEQWGVRNSSLMLFTVLSNRTVGIKPTFNLLQFFHKCPSLLQFVQNQLHSFTEASLNTMYPPLYPIVLLFSRLLPFDLKQKTRLTLNGSTKQIRKQQLLSLLPILDKSGLNNNYMGRVMTAKAILPFMQIDQINQYCIKGMQNLTEYFNKNNNMLHYQLTKYYHLLTSYNQIWKNSMRKVQIQKNLLERIRKFMQDNIQKISLLNCPVVQECFIKIFHYYFETYSKKYSYINFLDKEMIEQFKIQEYNQLINKIYGFLRSLINKYVFNTERLVIMNDLGHSMMRKQAVSFQLDLIIKYGNKFEQFKNIAVEFTSFLSKKLSDNQIFFQTSDNQLCEFYLQKILENIKNLKQNQAKELQTSLIEMLQKLQLSKIKSDVFLIKVLQLRIAVKFNSTQTNVQKQFLLKLQKQSNNHFLKIAIFRYLNYIKESEVILKELLIEFSNPNSLQELRECAVEYLLTLNEYKQSLNIVYIRLLEDQQYQIRKETAQIISRQRKCYNYNENVVKNSILAEINLQDLQMILKQNTDFHIKRKNHEQERIFSYDKPNKFRSDINTLIQILVKNQKIYQDNENLSINQIFFKSINQNEQKNNITEEYLNNVLSRNQYQFEIIIRKIVQKCSDLEQLKSFQQISHKHQLFEQLYQKVLQISQNKKQ